MSDRIFNKDLHVNYMLDKSIKIVSNKKILHPTPKKKRKEIHLNDFEIGPFSKLLSRLRTS